MALNTTPFDAAEFLDTPEAVEAFLADAFSEGDPRYIAHAMGIVARAKGMSQLAEQTGLQRQSLYRALSDGGNPEFATVLKVLDAWGFRLAPARRELVGAGH